MLKYFPKIKTHLDNITCLERNFIYQRKKMVCILYHFQVESNNFPSKHMHMHAHTYIQ